MVTVEKEWLEQAPFSLDYRDQNLVTEVKDQLSCGSGFVFSAIGNIEGQYAKKYKKLISFSEQEGLDCDIMPGEGCDDGGQMISIMNTLVQMGGIVTEEDYPYVGIKGTTCHLNKDQIVAKVLRGQIISTQTEDLLKDALAHIGPLAVSLYLPLTSVFYKRGVYSPPDCNRTPNLAMLVVGYGTDSDSGKNYWLIKNSWGKEWGEDGYLRLERRLGICNIGKEGTASAVVA